MKVGEQDDSRTTQNWSGSSTAYGNRFLDKRDKKMSKR